MGFLEEVKKKSNKDSVCSQDGAIADSYAPQQFADSIQQTMRALQAYLTLLAEHLNRTSPGTLISYEVEGSKGLSGLRQKDFKVSVDNETCIRTCWLRYVCQRDLGIDFSRPNKESGQRQQQYLWKHKLHFTSRTATNERWLFNLESFVPVEFAFEVEPEKFDIKLKVMNHDSLGLVSYTYDYEDINPLFLDELAKYVIHKPSRFHALSGNVVPDDTLAKLRRQLAERKAERARAWRRCGKHDYEARP